MTRFLVTGVLVLLAGAVAGVPMPATRTPPPMPEGPPLAADPSVPPPEPHYPTSGVPARDALRRLAAGLGQGPPAPPPTPKPGACTEVHWRQWPAPGTTASATGEQVRRRWCPGGQPEPMFDAVAYTPEALAGQLTYHAEKRQLSLPGVISVMNSEHCLTPDQRAATLQILADTGQLTYLGRVDDRIGRPGVAFSVANHDQHGRAIREILVFDENTGALLSYEQQLPVTAADPESASSTVLSFMLYLDCGQSAEQATP